MVCALPPECLWKKVAEEKFLQTFSFPYFNYNTDEKLCQ
jgi:hypothetical protein